MRHNYIGTEHLLLGLIREEGGVAGRVLRELGLEADRVQEIVERLTGPGALSGRKAGTFAGTQQVLEYAVEEARQMGHHYIGTEHLLIGIGAVWRRRCHGCAAQAGRYPRANPPPDPPSFAGEQRLPAYRTRRAARQARSPGTQTRKAPRPPWWTSWRPI